MPSRDSMIDSEVLPEPLMTVLRLNLPSTLISSNDFDRALKSISVIEDSIAKFGLAPCISREALAFICPPKRSPLKDVNLKIF